MMRRVFAASLLCSAMLFAAENVSAQRTNMSDVSGTNVSLFTRGMVRAFGAPPAPPPTLITGPALLEALCVERADAILTYATLSTTAESQAERTALALLRGGPQADRAAEAMYSTFVLAGADAMETEQFLKAAHGLLAPDRPEVAPVAAAVARHNDLVMHAPDSFLAQPPAELPALRVALGRLSAAVNKAVAEERVYPGLETRGMRYANGTDWWMSGQSIQVGGTRYLPYGEAIAIQDRQFRHFGDFNGVWILAKEPVPTEPKTVYVPVRTYCDVELLPYIAEERVIKKHSLLMRP